MTMFQPMPELTEDQYDALRDDIAKNGVIVPIVLDQRGRLLDGHNRRKIAAELGIECPSEVRQVADDDAAMALAVTLNCARRHLSREQVRQVIRGEIERRPDDSDRSIARRVGCSPSTVGAVRKEGVAPEITLTTREEAERSTEKIRHHLMEIRGSIYALVGRALVNHVSVPEVIGALTLGKLEWQKGTDRDPEIHKIMTELIWDYLIEVTSWPETLEQYPPHPAADPTPEERQWLIDSIVMMGSASGEHPADSPRTGETR